MSDLMSLEPKKKKTHPCIKAKHDVVKIYIKARKAILCQTCDKWLGSQGGSL
tara:strand:- start:1071 stop:1226 length:156 start_codon:yes stop_codon:yes gene_type:complete